jgi:hypothetical protein
MGQPFRHALAAALRNRGVHAAVLWFAWRLSEDFLRRRLR